MKHRLLSSLFICIFATSFTSCDTVTEILTGCGPLVTKKVEIVTKHNDPGTDRDDHTYVRADQMSFYYEGFNTVFYYDIEDQNVCTHKHVSVDVSASTLISSQIAGTIGARADWGLLYGSPIPLTESSSSVFHHVQASDFQIGLKQVYGDGPGLFVVRVTVSIPTVNSSDPTQDARVLEDVLGFSGIIDVRYYRHSA